MTLKLLNLSRPTWVDLPSLIGPTRTRFVRPTENTSTRPAFAPLARSDVHSDIWCDDRNGNPVPRRVCAREGESLYFFSTCTQETSSTFRHLESRIINSPNIGLIGGTTDFLQSAAAVFPRFIFSAGGAASHSATRVVGTRDGEEEEEENPGDG